MTEVTSVLRLHYKLFTPNGWQDYVYWQTEDKKTLKKSTNLSMISAGTVTKVLVSLNL